MSGGEANGAGACLRMRWVRARPTRPFVECVPASEPLLCALRPWQGPILQALLERPPSNPSHTRV